jgi:hypothetical protein
MQSVFFFLFRTDQGVIDRATWLKGMAGILAPILALSAGWIALEPNAMRGPDLARGFDAGIVVAFLYLLLYTFAVILAAVCFYNLSAKRFRARGRPASLAGLLPFSAFVTGAAFWLAPRSEGYFSIAIAYALAGLTLAIAIGTTFDLGIASEPAP